MIVSRTFAAVVALVALLVVGGLFGGAGCSRRDGDALPPETDEPLFVQGVQLKRQTRLSEALACFLKVIEKRGERFAAESHLEAGALYLNHTKDPVEAYHHFRKYLELQPNSRQAPYVRGMVDAAKREFYKTLAAPPQGDPSARPSDHAVRLAMDEEVEKLRRENSELRAELQTLRGGVASARQAKMIALPPERTASAGLSANARPADTPMIAAPIPSQSSSTVQLPAKKTTTAAKTTAAPVKSTTAPAKITATPVAKSPAPRGAGSGRTHTVQPKETLYQIARQHRVSMEDLARVNGITNPASVPAGAVLKIP